MKERLRQGSGEENRQAVIATAEGSSPSRWTLRRALGVLVSTISVITILSFLGWTGIIRLVRGEFLSLSERDLVLAGALLECQGEEHHLPPHSTDRGRPLVVAATFGIAGALVTACATPSARA